MQEIILCRIRRIDLSSRCRGKLAIKFREVEEYIAENDKSNIDTAAEACAIEVRQIQQWIREKRLALAQDSPIRIPCEGSGALIRRGSLCAACEANRQYVISDLARIIREPAPQKEEDRHGEEWETNHGMHYISRNRNIG